MRWISLRSIARATFMVVVVSLLCVASPAIATEAQPVVKEPTELRIRLEAGLGPNLCTDNGNALCAYWPPGSLYDQDTAGYGRLSATFFYPDLVDFLGGALVMDLGGYTNPTSGGSVTFGLSAMVRGFFELEETLELTVGLGLGLSHFAADPGWTWTGVILPMAVGVGYPLTEGWMLGGDLMFQPRLVGDVPFTTQIGLYLAYTFPMVVGGDGAQ